MINNTPENKVSTQLQEDVVGALGQGCIRRVRIATVLQRLSSLIGACSGLIAGLATKEGVFFVVVGGGITLATYHYSESYLLRIDQQLFATPRMSKRDLFDRHFARQVEQDIGIEMTEPSALMADAAMTDEMRRSLFRERLQSRLEREFRTFDWKYFVREVVRYIR